MEELEKLLEEIRKYLYNEVSFATGRSDLCFHLLSNRIIERNELRVSIPDMVKFLNGITQLECIKNIILNKRCSRISFLNISFDIMLKGETNHINVQVNDNYLNKKILLTIDEEYSIEEDFDRILNLCAEHKFDKFVGIHVSKYKQFRAV